VGVVLGTCHPVSSLSNISFYVMASQLTTFKTILVNSNGWGKKCNIQVLAGTKLIFFNINPFSSNSRFLKIFYNIKIICGCKDF